ncbi:hypothetical protein BAE44_0003627, partial [Dichanthelium oligosanthes]
LYETQIEQLSNFQLQVHDQGAILSIIMIESEKATTNAVDALRSGSSAVKTIQQSLLYTILKILITGTWMNWVWYMLCWNIADIENTIEAANGQTYMREIQEALATPVGASADFDEVLSLSFVLVNLRQRWHFS